MALLAYNEYQSMNGMRTDNDAPFQFGRNVTREPASVISIFTVNTRDQYSSSGKRMFPGRTAEQRYRKVGALTDPMYSFDTVATPEKSQDDKKITDESGVRVAMDWLNPDNIQNLDQDFVVSNLADRSNDLLARGLFFIVRPFNILGNAHDGPTEDEVKAAENRLKRRYNALIQLYQTTNASNPGRLPEIMSEEMHDALTWGGVKTPYNTTIEQRVPCVNCGELKLATAKFHKSDALGGRMCIEPTQEGWKAAVYANAVNRDDVPEEFRWAGRTPNAK